MERLKELCRASSKRTRLNPPAMNVIYQDGVAEELAAAIQAALAKPGADHAAIYELVTDTIRADGLDFVDDCIDAALLQGLHPDTLVAPRARSTLLHDVLSRKFPPYYEEEEGQRGRPSLKQLLDRGPTPNLQVVQGNTALHLLVLNTAQERFFPDLPSHLAFQVGDEDDLYRDEERVEFLESVGTALLRAGWSLDEPNRQGNTPRRLLQLSHQVAQEKRQRLRRSQGMMRELLGAMAEGNRRQGRPGGLPGESEGRVDQSVQRRMGWVDQMEAVLDRLAAFAPPP